MLIEIGVRTVGAWLVVTPVGDLDLASVPQLRQEVMAGLAALPGVGAGPHPGADGRGAGRDVVVDLGSVDFIDSVGLGGVVAVAKRVRGAGGRFRVARPEPRVWEVFRIVGLDAVFDCFPSVEAATGD